MWLINRYARAYSFIEFAIFLKSCGKDIIKFITKEICFL